MAMEENKAQRKEAEDEGVFFGFGDDLAVDDNPHRAAGIGRKKRSRTDVIEGSCKEVANRFAQNAGAYPSGSIPGVIGHIASRDTNPDVIWGAAILIHKKMGNGSALLPLATVGVLVAVTAKVMLVRPPPGILALTEAMSLVLALENKGESWKLVSLGLLAL